MKLFDNLLHAIGNTPLVRIPFDSAGKVYAKLEYLNPGGSIKDRAALYMIEEAGFIWPFGKQNFKRWFCVSSQEYFVVMAETALAILARIFGLRNTDKLNIKSHIPE